MRQLKDSDCQATAIQDKPESRLEETAVCAVEAEQEDKIEGVMEQTGELGEMQEDIRETFSEEDLTGRPPRSNVFSLKQICTR